MKRYAGRSASQEIGEQRCFNSELWHACAGPLVSLPAVGICVVYFPQGHSEQVAASTNKEIDIDIPNYPNLPTELICRLHNVTLHADIETDEVYAQMILQPLNLKEQKESYLDPDLPSPSRQLTNYFCKTLTPSDTSTHGGFSIPRRAAEKVFPALDFTQQPPARELVARDLHDNEWKFRHVFRGQPKRHLLTTGWSMFASSKRLVAGDSVLFIRNEKGQLLLGIRRANRAQTVVPSSVLSSESMHIGILAAAAHAAATNGPFTVFYNPRACPSEFVIPLSKYERAVYHVHVAVGMRFRMPFETENSSVRRYVGTVTGIGDVDPVRWPNSQWRAIKVGWDESSGDERKMPVSRWEIEPLATFLMYPSAYPIGLQCAWPQTQVNKNNHGIMKRPFMWMRGDDGEQNFHRPMCMDSWMQFKPRFDSSIEGIKSDMNRMTMATVPSQDTSVQSSKKLEFSQMQPMPSKKFQNGMLAEPQPHKHVTEQSQKLHENLPPQQIKNFQHQLFQDELVQQEMYCQPPQHTLKEQQPLFQQLLSQQKVFNVPNVAGTLVQLPMSQHQSTPSLMSPTCSKSIFANPYTNSSFTRDSLSPDRSMIRPLSSEESACHIDISRKSHVALQTATEILEVPGNSEDQQILPSLWSSPNSLYNDRPFQHVPTGQVSSSSGHTSLPVLQSNISPNSMHFGQFIFDACSSGHETNKYHSQSHLLCDINLDTPSSVICNTLTKNEANGHDIGNISFIPNLVNASCASGSDLPSRAIALSSRGLEECRILQGTTTLAQVNPCTRTFTKVYKLGSVGRSLDVTRFGSYLELRSELAHMFGLKGVLENPRSGWQLVFVDKENDVLLLGDDPWEEFMNSVRFIKVLSPPEVMQMSEYGMEFLGSISTR